ncbi:hypothetical protein SODALDRAFT_360553 [Sodiomyces alkalinus F11]|uniref:Uncharacterized protein n=1 Tax=Sodiomyces alkalinus (strain CBS 110278 / VKM F-3762 / F11) TaxID=1314773 RepID=A0A3N2PUQ4_SODAK|nr:hypothetical protein SODALDRAFT_360553 [Sodiomyces alkalinus F11]ROT38210.1 hypothetical protein SODALDRAFT_360553 [Sodiomyces alkalinus F11]
MLVSKLDMDDVGGSKRDKASCTLSSHQIAFRMSTEPASQQCLASHHDASMPYGVLEGQAGWKQQRGRLYPDMRCEVSSHRRRRLEDSSSSQLVVLWVKLKRMRVVIRADPRRNRTLHRSAERSAQRQATILSNNFRVSSREASISIIPKKKEVKTTASSVRFERHRSARRSDLPSPKSNMGTVIDKSFVVETTQMSTHRAGMKGIL